MRKLIYGAFLLGLGALFTAGVAAAMQQRATLRTPAFAPDDPSTASNAPRTDQEWMF